MKQLIDLNGDITNFELTFTATSKDGSVFDILIVDQTMLDSNQPLEYKKANGTMSGNIVSDKGVYQNFFLILKSDTNCDCEVMIDIKEIEPKSTVDLTMNKRQPIQQGKPFSINWNYVVCAIIAVGGGYILWNVYNKKPGTITDVVPTITKQPLTVPEIPSLPVKESLLSRLNKLNFD